MTNWSKICISFRSYSYFIRCNEVNIIMQGVYRLVSLVVRQKAMSHWCSVTKSHGPC